MAKEHIKKTEFNSFELTTILFFPIALIYLETALKFKTSLGIMSFWAPEILFSAAFGVFIGTICIAIGNEKVRRIAALAANFVICLYFTVEFFVKSAYQVFMTIDSISKGTGGVLTDFSDAFIKAIEHGIGTIILLFVPFILMLVITLVKKISFSFGVAAEKIKSVLICSVFAFLIMNLCGSLIVGTNENMRGIYRDAYNFDSVTKSFGLVTSTRLDLQYGIFGNPTSEEFVVEEPTEPETPPQTDPAEEEPVEEPEKEYSYNTLPINFDDLIANEKNDSIANVHKYVNSLSGTKQNDYTGLFKGKNLILIAAESFSAEVIDPELTPTLYRLSQNGFTFTDFYQPTWGGSTSTGEYAIITGLIPTSGVSSIRKIADLNCDFTIGNQLKKEGYFTAAYHDGSYDYYSRNLTHTKFGYDTFTAFGNGLEKGVDRSIWPASDLEMMEYTLNDYIDNEPFSIYYMSVSGHGFYTNFNNGMSTKNRSEVENLDHSTTVKAYIAANLEFEHALTYLVDELERAGKANDTVIAICADHYPYALEKGESWGNDEDYLAELYGYPATNNALRDHNALIIWSGCLEDENKDMSATITAPTYSLDILPTLCNLFGIEYDSRLLVGRDVFSEAEALVIWPDYCWKTEKGYYDYTRQKFTPTDESVIVDDAYIKSVNSVVKNKFSFSNAVINYDYFNIIFGEK